MKLLELYSLATGLKIKKQFLLEKVFPVEHPRYITIQAGSGMAAKNYPFYSEVLELLAPFLVKEGIKIYQVGGEKDTPIRGAENLLGKTDEHQTNYLLKRAILHIGNDSWCAHRAGELDVPVVVCYGSTSIANHSPYRYHKDSVFIESHRFGRQPSFATQEPYPTISLVPPESVANAALQILGQPPVVRKSLYFGPEYNLPIVEIVPNCVPAPQVQMVNPILRADYHFDEQLIGQNLQVRKCSVITNREINLNLLSQLKQNIAVVKVELNPSISVDWVRGLKRVGVPLQFYTLETDETKLRKMRLDLFEVEVYFDTFRFPDRDHLLKEMAKWQHKELDKELNLATLRFKTLKVLISDGRLYLSNAHRLAGIATDNVSNNETQVIDSPEFIKEQAHQYIFQ